MHILCYCFLYLTCTVCTTCIRLCCQLLANVVVLIRVRRFRLNFFFASKRNEAKQDPFRFVFACSSENIGPIFSLLFASFRFEFFASKRKAQTISLRFALQIFFSLHFLLSQTHELLYQGCQLYHKKFPEKFQFLTKNPQIFSAKNPLKFPKKGRFQKVKLALLTILQGNTPM
jgi:hypothetical protein